MRVRPNVFDVIIIGAGSIGTPLAMELASSKFKVLVVDCLSSVGQGSNKGAIGGIRATHSDPAKIRICKRSIEIFSTWKKNHGNDIEWHQGGYVFVAYREIEEKNLKNLIHLQKKYELTIDWLDDKELLDIAPDLNPKNLRGGTYSPQDGNASPLLANHAFYSYAKEKGAEFLFNSTVVNLIIENYRIKGIITNQGNYYAPIIINSAGAWAKKSVQWLKLKFPLHLIHMKLELQNRYPGFFIR